MWTDVEKEEMYIKFGSHILAGQCPKLSVKANFKKQHNYIFKNHSISRRKLYTFIYNSAQRKVKNVTPDIIRFKAKWTKFYNTNRVTTILGKPAKVRAFLVPDFLIFCLAPLKMFMYKTLQFTLFDCYFHKLFKIGTGDLLISIVLNIVTY